MTDKVTVTVQVTVTCERAAHGPKIADKVTVTAQVTVTWGGRRMGRRA
jgi:hypothetical protein